MDPFIIHRTTEDGLTDESHALQRGTFALPSFCTARFVQEYMRSGTLPPEGTLCKSLSPEDYEELEAYSELTEQEENLLVNLGIIGTEVDRMGGGLHVG